jgi:hypothetical protein
MQDGGTPQGLKIPQGSSAAIVLGPNGSGKSVLTRTINLNVLLALRIGYSKANLSMNGITSLAAYSGAESRADNHESYFQNALRKLAKLVATAQPGMMLTIDEIVGSDPIELAAIQLAILKRATEKGALVIYNTNLRYGLSAIGESEGYCGWKTDFVYNPDTNQLSPSYTLSPDPRFETPSMGVVAALPHLTAAQYAMAVRIQSSILSGA